MTPTATATATAKKTPVRRGSLRFFVRWLVAGALLLWSLTALLLKALPFPLQTGVLPGAEWLDLPQMVATELKLRLEQVGAKDVGGKQVRVFRYVASVEDRVCWVYFHKQRLFRRSQNRQLPVACRGEVWTDAELNPLRISRELEIPAGKVPMRLVQLAVLYGWLERDLVPVEMTVRALVAGQACRSDAHFSNYRLGNR